MDTSLIAVALIDLSRTNRIWMTNVNLFLGYDKDMRQWWWGRAKEQADKGVPAMQELVAKVIELRMLT